MFKRPDRQFLADIKDAGLHTKSKLSIVTRVERPVKFDLDYALSVIKEEAEAINAITPIVNESFAKACEMIYTCSGSVIISGIGKAGIIGQKISATLASTGTPGKKSR